MRSDKGRENESMTKEELKAYCQNAVIEINMAAQPDKEYLFDAFIRNLKQFLDGAEYAEYRNGIVTNEYINFDSNSGLTMVTASVERYRLANTGIKTLKEAVSILSNIDERGEYWEDLVDESYVFSCDPEYVAERITSVLDPWVGEEDFAKQRYCRVS